VSSESLPRASLLGAARTRPLAKSMGLEVGNRGSSDLARHRKKIQGLRHGPRTCEGILCGSGRSYVRHRESEPSEISACTRIERNAFVLALDRVLGQNASEINRGEHSFKSPDQLRKLLMDARFAKVEVQTVVQQIAFPLVLDCVRFQLRATPMAALLSDITRRTDRRP
jgi:hypothetical protein